ncbi:hypothetical protein G9A89_010159 [Geosiphon pyriformis]|nr:hypothetical protein G9A89_010159 [Geosiphon pyriformis]
MTVLVSSEKKAHIYEKCYASSIIESAKHYYFSYPPSLPITLISCGSQRCKSVTTVVNKVTLELTAIFIPILAHVSANNIGVNISTTYISTPNLSTTATSNISTIATSNLSTLATSNNTPKPHPNNIRKPQIQSHPKLKISDGGSPTDLQFTKSLIKIIPNYLSFLITPEDVPSNKQKTHHIPTPTNNIPPAIITKNKLLDAIFSFKLEEPSVTPLFSGAIFKKKPITVMYTDAKVDGHSIKLILDRTPIEAIWRRTVKCLDRCPYNDNEIWEMTFTKIEGTLLEEIKMIKNNSPKPIELD